MSIQKKHYSGVTLTPLGNLAELTHMIDGYDGGRKKLVRQGRVRPLVRRRRRRLVRRWRRRRRYDD